MSANRSLPTARAVARFYTQPLRIGLLRAIPGRADHGTWNLRLGPITFSGHTLLLRSPRLGDAGPWREVRLRERKRIEPWWMTSPLSWEERHTRAEWVATYLETRAAALAGRAMPLVIVCDGRLAGQVNLESISFQARVAEIGVWLDSAVAGSGMSTAAAALMIDYAMLDLGLVRLTAPISKGNREAIWGARRVGMVREGIMKSYLDVGGRRRDHELWALTRERLPLGGLTAALPEAHCCSHPSGRPARNDVVHNG